MQNKYCIEHEKMVDVELFDEDGMELHADSYRVSGGIKISFCDGPFASSPPPALPEGWELVIEEPSFEELVMMNITANQLVLDLEGA